MSLIHRRLSILDLSELGNCPMPNEDGSIRDGERTLFASSLPTLLAYDEEPRPMNPDAIVCCLSTASFRLRIRSENGIGVFPSAHYGVIDGEGALSLHRYWNFPDERSRTVAVSVAEREVERVLDDSVRRYLDAYVPVGVFLSGGVDSSLVAALAARQHPGLHSFSVGFEEAAWSELGYARKVASHLGLEQHEIHRPPKGCSKNPPQARLALRPTLRRCLRCSHLHGFELGAAACQSVLERRWRR